MSDSELKAKAGELQKQIFRVSFQKTTAPVDNPVQVRAARRTIALINTLLRQRELAAAVKTEENK